MANRRSDSTARYLGTLWSVGALGGLSDGELLGRFADGDREGGEAAFAALVERHGPMVLRVCRVALADPHDADDAFQATFLAAPRSHETGGVAAAPTPLASGPRNAGQFCAQAGTDTAAASIIAESACRVAAALICRSRSPTNRPARRAGCG